MKSPFIIVAYDFKNVSNLLSSSMRATSPSHGSSCCTACDCKLVFEVDYCFSIDYYFYHYKCFGFVGITERF